MAIRFDSAELGQAERTAQGGLRYPATLTRSGVFLYTEPDGSVRREYRPPSEVFAPEALASMRGAPVTHLHPPEGSVRADTWRRVAVGHVGEDITTQGDHVAAHVYVQDADVLAAIEGQGLREISLGYDTLYVASPGTTPEGEAYDGIQTRIRVNHAALVPRGRAGASVGLRLDADDNQQIPESHPTMKIKIAGKEYVAGSPECEAALSDLEARGSRADALEAEASAARAALRREQAASVGIRTDAATESEVMLQVLSKLAPDLAVDGQSPDFVMGAFLAAMTIKLAEPVAEEPEPVQDDESEAPPEPAGPSAAAVRSDALDLRRKNAPVKPTLRQDSVKVPAIGPADRARIAMIERANGRA